jgi:hypothetical protein
MYTKNWKRQVRKNWKILLISLIMALSLISRGLGSMARSQARDTTTPAGAAPVQTVQVGGK